MSEHSAELYDLIYAQMGKDYEGEANQLHDLIQEHKRCPENSLLDVACGTGGHIAYFKEFYEVEGLDLDPYLLALARQKHPEAVFHPGDMTAFDLGKTFAAVTCLFSAIGYVKTLERLQQAITCMVNHLNPGGVLIVEPWFSPDAVYTNTVHVSNIDEPELKITRMNAILVEGNVSVMKIHYLVGTPRGVRHFTELHELGLFTHEEYVEAFRSNGVELYHDTVGLTGRGLYVAGKAK